MSAYSAEMLEACKTVTLKVKVLPIFRWDSAFSGERSRGRSRPRPELFTGLRGASTTATQKTHASDITTFQMNLTLNKTFVSAVVWREHQGKPHLDSCCC